MDILNQPDRMIEEIKINSYKRDRTVFLFGEIDDDNTFKTIYFFERIVDLDEKENIPINQRKPITLKIDCPGGTCTNGLAIISTMQSLIEKGYTIETRLYGMACSMAFVIACVGSKGHRYVHKHSQLMIHQLIGGKFGWEKLQDSIEDTEWSKKINERIVNIVMENTNITKEQLDDILVRKFDWWMWPEKAIELSVVDKII